MRLPLARDTNKRWGQLGSGGMAVDGSPIINACMQCFITSLGGEFLVMNEVTQG